ncbi:GDSL esterase/lipase, partial [Mucuna pruriens]
MEEVDHALTSTTGIEGQSLVSFAEVADSTNSLLTWSAPSELHWNLPGPFLGRIGGPFKIWGLHTFARKNISMESIDFSVEDKDEIERLEAVRMKLQTQIVEEVRANEKLQSDVVRMFQEILHNARFYGFIVLNRGRGIGRNRGQITCLPFQTPCLNKNQYVF